MVIIFIDSKGEDKGGGGCNEGGDSEDKGTGKEKEKDKDFAKKALKAHNIYRKVHKVPELKLNETMSKEAEEYAEKIAESMELKHSKSEDGENLALGCSSEEYDDLTAGEATMHW